MGEDELNRRCTDTPCANVASMATNFAVMSAKFEGHMENIAMRVSTLASNIDKQGALVENSVDRLNRGAVIFERQVTRQEQVDVDLADQKEFNDRIEQKLADHSFGHTGEHKTLERKLTLNTLVTLAVLISIMNTTYGDDFYAAVTKLIGMLKPMLLW